MNDMILKIISEVIIPLVIAGLGILGGQVLFRLKTKIGNDNIKMALDQLSKITKTVVANLNQTVVAYIRSKTVDGKLSSADMREIKAKAIMLIKAQMQTEFLDLLAKNTIDVDGLISSEIEASVYELKCNLLFPPPH